MKQSLGTWPVCTCSTVLPLWVAGGPFSSSLTWKINHFPLAGNPTVQTLKVQMQTKAKPGTVLCSPVSH